MTHEPAQTASCPRGASATLRGEPGRGAKWQRQVLSTVEGTGGAGGCPPTSEGPAPKCPRRS